MKRDTISFFVLLLSLAIGTIACDDGRIYEEERVVVREGSVVRLTATVTGNDSWPAGYSLVLAGFEEGNDYAQLAKGLGIASDGSVSLTLGGVTSDIDRLEICVINKLRKRVTSFYQTVAEQSPDTVYINAGAIDAGLFTAIQTQVFDANCASCHGASTAAAGGLFLTDGRSYEALVNVPAITSPEGKPLVAPGDAAGSYLMDVLEEGASAHYHVDILSGHSDALALLRDWIEAGAPE